MLDLWQVPLSGIDSTGGTFVVATEDYEGDIAVPKGAKLLRSRTSMAVFFARGLVIDGDMDAAVRAVADSQIYPLAKADSPPKTKVHYASGVAMDTLSPMNPRKYWERVAVVLQYLNPEVDQDAVPGKETPDAFQPKFAGAAPPEKWRDKGAWFPGRDG